MEQEDRRGVLRAGLPVEDIEFANFTVLCRKTGCWAVAWPPRPSISAVAAASVKGIRGLDERVIVVLRSRVRGLVCPVVRKDSTP